MTRRLQAFLIVVLATPGLLGRASLVVHEHEGGADLHHHHAHDARLVGYVGHSHPHGAVEREPEPATEGEPSGEDRSPVDGDRHGHYQSVQAMAVRRMSPLEDGGGRHLLGVALCRLAPAYEQPGEAPFRPPASRGDPRGHPTSRTGRTVDRLVQGIGLLI